MQIQKVPIDCIDTQFALDFHQGSGSGIVCSLRVLMVAGCEAILCSDLFVSLSLFQRILSNIVIIS